MYNTFSSNEVCQVMRYHQTSLSLSDDVVYVMYYGLHAIIIPAYSRLYSAQKDTVVLVGSSTIVSNLEAVYFCLEPNVVCLLFTNPFFALKQLWLLAALLAIYWQSHHALS